MSFMFFFFFFFKKGICCVKYRKEGLTDGCSPALAGCNCLFCEVGGVLASDGTDPPAIPPLALVLVFPGDLAPLGAPAVLQNK